MNKEFLIEKFWEGKTSPEEENLLRKWVSEDKEFANLNPDLAAYFDASSFDEETLSEEIKESLLNIPTSLKNNTQRKKQYNWMMAASIAMVFIILGVQNSYQQKEQREAEEQFALLKEQMGVMSKHLSKYRYATQELSNAQKTSKKHINP
jgi:glutamate synthase domain-containing protein 3